MAQACCLASLSTVLVFKKGCESYTHPCSRAMSSELRVVASVAKLTMAAILSQANGLASIARAHPMVRCGSYGLATVARAHPMVRCGSGGLATVARAHPMVRCESEVQARSGDRRITQARVRHGVVTTGTATGNWWLTTGKQLRALPRTPLAALQRRHNCGLRNSLLLWQSLLEPS